MALSQKKLDFDDLINDINLAKDMLAVKCPQTIDSSELQYLEDHDRHRLLEAAQGLISQLESPEVTALRIAKGVRLL